MLRLIVPIYGNEIDFDGLKDSKYKTRETDIKIGGFKTVQLSIMFCSDKFISELNKEWRDEDHATDVLYMSQHLPN